MKSFILVFLLLTAIGCCQFQSDTLEIDITLPAMPPEVLAQIHSYQMFLETFSSTQPARLYSGMSFDEARALQFPLVATNAAFPYMHILPANGDSVGVAVFGLDVNGREIVYMLDQFNRYDIKCGVVKRALPYTPNVVIHDVFIEVNIQ